MTVTTIAGCTGVSLKQILNSIGKRMSGEVFKR